MAMTSKPAKQKRTRRRKRRRKPHNEPVYYVMQIESWDWSLSFGVSQSKHFDDPYMDYRHLELNGRLLQPTNIKANMAEAILIPDKNLNEENRQQHQPKSVGSLNLSDGKLRALLSIPQDVLDTILQMLAAERFKYIVITGDKLHYRQAMVKSFRLECELDEDDLPPEEI